MMLMMRDEEEALRFLRAPVRYDVALEDDYQWWMPAVSDTKGGQPPHHPFIAVRLIAEAPEAGCEVEDSDGRRYTISRTQLQRAVTSKFALVEDNAMLPELSEPTVLHNLVARYRDDLIYTKSGLFLVAINPYKRLDHRIYTEDLQRLYSRPTSSEEELPPHLYGVLSRAYRDLFANGQSQSILITYPSLR